VPDGGNSGASSAEISGGVPRGERDCFTLAVRVGQRLSISQPGRPETNIVLQLYQPPWHVRRADDSIEIAGRALPGAAEGADTTHWSGVLPRSGAYLLVVGTSWGGGEYRLRLVIR
jgi:hypothetical protein